jgi:hypothetical protein
MISKCYQIPNFKEYKINRSSPPKISKLYKV